MTACLLALAMTAVRNPRRFGTDTALWTAARGTDCATLYRLLADVLPAEDELVALELGGWRVTDVTRRRISGAGLHECGRGTAGRGSPTCAAARTRA